MSPHPAATQASLRSLRKLGCAGHPPLRGGIEPGVAARQANHRPERIAVGSHLHEEEMCMINPGSALALPPELQAVFEQDYPRFSEAEYKRRHEALAGVMERAGVDHLLIVSAQNVGNATRWVTGWPGTNEALTIFRPGEAMTMFVEYYNHVPQARMIARGVDVRWGEEKGILKVNEELTRRGARRIGIIGPLNGPKWKTLEASHALVSLDAD